MPRGKKSVTVKYQKAQRPQKKRGRKKLDPLTNIPDSRRNEFLQERREWMDNYLAENPEAKEKDALKAFQDECDCSLTPHKVLAVGGGVENRYEIRSCMSCGTVTRK